MAFVGIAKKCKKCQCIHRPPFDDMCPGEADGDEVSGSGVDGSRSGPTVNIEIPSTMY